MTKQKHSRPFVGIMKLFVLLVCTVMPVVTSHGALEAKTVTRTTVGFSVDATGVQSSGASAMERHSEGPLSLVDVDGQHALRLDGRPSSSFRYFYVDIDDQAIFDGPFDAVITLNYLAKEPGRFRVQFDSAATASRTQSSEYIYIEEADVGQWVSTSVSLPDVRFRNAQNGRGDLRIVTSGDLALYVKELDIALQGVALYGADETAVFFDLEAWDGNPETAGTLGVLHVHSDSAVQDFPLTVRARMTRLDWDYDTGRYRHEPQGDIVIVDRLLDLSAKPVAIPLTWPDALLAERDLWQVALTAVVENADLSLAGGEQLFANYRGPKPEADGPFTIAVLPDTQYYSFVSPRGGHPDMFLRQAHWLAKEAADRNIAFMLHVGDLTEHNSVGEWAVAARSIQVLDGIIPYVLALGNHDIGPPGTRGTHLNSYFPMSRYGRLKSFGGVHAEGKLDNSYHTFDVAGRKFLVVSIEFWPRDEVVAWANDVVAAHPDHEAIILTHTYTGSNGRRRSTGYTYSVGQGTGEGLNTGEDLWEKLVRKHPNIFLVLSGHVPHSAAPRDVAIGDHGNIVYEILLNYQFNPNGGNGWLALLEFRPEDQRIDVNVYSPTLGEYKQDDKGGFYVPFSIDLIEGRYIDPR